MTQANTDDLVGGFPKIFEGVFGSCSAEGRIAPESPGSS